MEKLERLLDNNLYKISIILIIITLLVSIYTTKQNNILQKKTITEMQYEISKKNSLLKKLEMNNNMIFENYSNIGKNFKLDCITKFKNPKKLVVISKHDEPFIIRKRIESIINSLSIIEKGIKVIYITDYNIESVDTISGFVYINNQVLLSSLYAPSIYLIDDNNTILSHFNITLEFKQDEYEIISRIIKRIFL